MNHYRCSYAYDVPYYADFVIQAESAEAAEAKLSELLELGCFSAVHGEPFYDGIDDDRVIVQARIEPDELNYETPLEMLEGFSPPPVQVDR